MPIIIQGLELWIIIIFEHNKCPRAAFSGLGIFVDHLQETPNMVETESFRTLCKASISTRLR